MLASVMVVSSRLSAPPRSALPEKSLELLTITLRISSSSVDNAPSRRPLRRTTPANHEMNPLVGRLPVLRRSGWDVVVPTAADASSLEDSGDWRPEGSPFPGIPCSFRAVSLSISNLPAAAAVCCSVEVSRPGVGEGGRDEHPSARELMLPLRRARSRASRRLTALSRRR